MSLLMWQEVELRWWCEQWGAPRNTDKSLLRNPLLTSAARFLTGCILPSWWHGGLGPLPQGTRVFDCCYSQVGHITCAVDRSAYQDKFYYQSYSQPESLQTQPLYTWPIKEAPRWCRRNITRQVMLFVSFKMFLQFLVFLMCYLEMYFNILNI